MTDSTDSGAVDQAVRARAIQSLARAFHTDPAFLWMFPDERTRAARLERFFAWVLDDMARSDLILTGEGGGAVTVWRLPGHATAQRPRSLRELFLGLSIFGTRLVRAMELAAAIQHHLPAGQDYLYLNFAAVDPALQGRGLGPQTIQRGLETADRLGVPTCLETCTPHNVALYRRMGFDVIQHWNVPKGGPAFWTMSRPVSGRRLA